jgi:hypothetical protein
MEKLKKFAQ